MTDSFIFDPLETLEEIGKNLLRRSSFKKSEVEVFKYPNDIRSKPNKCKHCKNAVFHYQSGEYVCHYSFSIGGIVSSKETLTKPEWCPL